MNIKVKKKMPTIENWVLCATTSMMNIAVSLDMITIEMIKNPNLKFDTFKCRDDEVVSMNIIGNVYNAIHYNNGTFLKTACIEKIENGIATTTAGRKYRLGKMHPDYKMFVNCINTNKPVLFNYVFGTDWLSDKNKVFVSGNIYVDGDIKYIAGEVEKQNFENHTIVIDGVEYFVNWMSMNERMRKRYNPFPKSNLLNNIPIYVDVENETFAGEIFYGKEINLFETDWDIDLMRNRALFEAPKRLKFK